MRQDSFSLFEQISLHFIEKEANLFAYSPGFRDLYIKVTASERHFLLKFNEVFSAKVLTSWKFKRITVEEIISGDNNLLVGAYRVSDSCNLEIVCEAAYVIELIDDQNV
jgi:hypothetical protein